MPQDDIEGYKWFSLGATYGDGEQQETSVEMRDFIAERFTPEQLAEGQKSWRVRGSKHTRLSSPVR